MRRTTIIALVLMLTATSLVGATSTLGLGDSMERACLPGQDNAACSQVPLHTAQAAAGEDACESHPPIRIVGNEGPRGFIVGHDPVTGEPIYRPGSGVVDGNGTADDPYVIAGWCIVPAPLRNGITIEDTTAPVVVRDNVLDGELLQINAVHLLHASNVTLTDNTMVNNYRSVFVESSSDVSLYDNVLGDNWGIAVRISGSSAVGVDNNTVDESDYGVYVEDSTGVAITSNAIMHNNWGIVVDASNAEAHWNNIEGNDYGLHGGTTDNPVNATRNWWGASDGPWGYSDDACTGTSPSGHGDRVSDMVCFDPWLTSPNPHAGADP